MPTFYNYEKLVQISSITTIVKQDPVVVVVCVLFSCAKSLTYILYHRSFKHPDKEAF